MDLGLWQKIRLGEIFEEFCKCFSLRYNQVVQGDGQFVSFDRVTGNVHEDTWMMSQKLTSSTVWCFKK